MDFDIVPSEDIVTTIVTGTNGYLVTLAPIFIVVMALVFSVILITLLIDLFKDWLYEREILSEYTELRRQESILTGDTFGDYDTEYKRSKTLIKRANINESVVTKDADQLLGEISERKSALQKSL